MLTKRQRQILTHLRAGNYMMQFGAKVYVGGFITSPQMLSSLLGLGAIRQGPDKFYEITETGKELLGNFVEV